MPAELSVVSLLPEILDANGDAANARVLVARARWAGLAAEHRALGFEDWTHQARPDVVTIGTGADQDLRRAQRQIIAHSSLLTGWWEDGAEFIAIGAGWELLSGGIETTADGLLAGVGLFPGRAVERSSRVTDDILVDVSGEADAVVGFENHSRSFVGVDEADALGRVRYGYGNGDGAEGYRVNRLLGSHVHGPLLAKNPSLADEILRRVASVADLVYSADNELARQADESARSAREVISSRVLR